MAGKKKEPRKIVVAKKITPRRALERFAKIMEKRLQDGDNDKTNNPWRGEDADDVLFPVAEMTMADLGDALEAYQAYRTAIENVRTLKLKIEGGERAIVDSLQEELDCLANAAANVANSAMMVYDTLQFDIDCRKDAIEEDKS